MSNEHICSTCRNKKCPEAGSEKYDGMLGPTIMCPDYTPSLWSLECVVTWAMLLGVVGIALCIIHYCTGRWGL